jgi:hypothetical protein
MGQDKTALFTAEFDQGIWWIGRRIDVGNKAVAEIETHIRKRCAVALSLSALWVAGVAGYITHVVWCIQMLIAGEPLQNSHLFLAGLGLFFAPAGAATV